MDQTDVFRELLKSRSMEQKRVDNPAKSRQADVLYSQAKEILRDISEIRDFILLQKDNHTVFYSCEYGDPVAGMAKADAADVQIEQALVQCKKYVKSFHQLTSERGQEDRQIDQVLAVIAHLNEKYLTEVCSLFNRQRAVRLNKTMEFNKYSRLSSLVSDSRRIFEVPASHLPASVFIAPYPVQSLLKSSTDSLGKVYDASTNLLYSVTSPISASSAGHSDQKPTSISTANEQPPSALTANQQPASTANEQRPSPSTSSQHLLSASTASQLPKPNRKALSNEDTVQNTDDPPDDELSMGLRRRNFEPNLSPKQDSISSHGHTESKSGMPIFTATNQDLEQSSRMDLSDEQLNALKLENEVMYKGFQQKDTELQTVERKVEEIARLQNIFTQKVYEQESDIVRINKSAEDTTENITSANDLIREAIKHKAALRVWILFFLLVMTFTLFFLHWYNP